MLGLGRPAPTVGLARMQVRGCDFRPLALDLDIDVVRGSTRGLLNQRAAAASLRRGCRSLWRADLTAGIVMAPNQRPASSPEHLNRKDQASTPERSVCGTVTGGPRSVGDRTARSSW